MKWKHFPRNWPFVQGIHRSPVNSPHKGQWRGILMIFFYQHLNKQLSKHWWGWWFETPSHPLWRQCTEISKLTLLSPMNMKMIQYRSMLMHADIPRFCDDHIRGEFGRINNVYRLSLYVIMPHGQYRSHKKAVCVMTWTSLLMPCWMVKNLPFDC